MEIGYNEGGSYDDKELHKHRSKKLSNAPADGVSAPTSLAEQNK